MTVGRHGLGPIKLSSGGHISARHRGTSSFSRRGTFAQSMQGSAKAGAFSKDWRQLTTSSPRGQTSQTSSLMNVLYSWCADWTGPCPLRGAGRPKRESTRSFIGGPIFPVWEFLDCAWAKSCTSWWVACLSLPGLIHPDWCRIFPRAAIFPMTPPHGTNALFACGGPG